MSELHSSVSLHISAQKDRGKEKKDLFESGMFILPGFRYKPAFHAACIISSPSQFYTLYEPCRDVNAAAYLDFNFSREKE